LWNEKATFEIKHTSGELKLDIYDEDTFSNDYNAGALIPLKMLCKLDGSDEWHLVYYKEKVVGKIHLRTRWIPDTPVVITTSRVSEPFKKQRPQQRSLDLRDAKKLPKPKDED